MEKWREGSAQREKDDADVATPTKTIPIVVYDTPGSVASSQARRKFQAPYNPNRVWL